MALSRTKIDAIADLAADAIISELQTAKTEGKRPSAATLASALKLLDRIETKPAEPPVIEKTAPQTEAERVRTVKERLVATSQWRTIPYLSEADRAEFEAIENASKASHPSKDR